MVRVTAALPGLSLLLLTLGAAPMVVAGDWSLPDSRMGVRTAPRRLLTRPDVQADLKLDEAQRAGLGRQLDELGARAAALRGKTGPEVIAARRAIDTAQQAWLDAALSESQRARLAEIDLQWEGPSALVSRGWVAERLGLDAAQLRSIAEVLSRGGGTNDPGEVGVAVESRLRPEQLERWRALLGPPFRPVPVQETPGVAAGP